MKPLVKINIYAAGKGLLYYKAPSGKEHLKEVTGEGKGQEILLNTILSALKTFNCPSKIELRMPQGQIKTAIRNHWPEKWAASGWANVRGKPVKYNTLWQLYVKLSQGHEIEVKEE